MFFCKIWYDYPQTVDKWDIKEHKKEVVNPNPRNLQPLYN